MINNISFIQSPFEVGKKYLVRTVTFYYLATYTKRKGNFYYFENVHLVLNIPDWQDFWQSRPSLPPAMKPISFPSIYLNQDGIVDVVPWE